MKTTILMTGLRFPEGPTFDDEGRLWCVEQEGEGLFCRHPDGKTERIYVGGKPNGLCCRSDGWLYFCDSGYNSIRRLHPATKKVETVVDQVNGEPLNKPNDLIVDSLGNLLFTCPGAADDDMNGYVAVVSKNDSTEIITEGLFYPNGLALLPNSNALLIAETHKQRIWWGLWDAQNISWENIRVWAQTSPDNSSDNVIGPDGMAVGPDGHVYVAIYGGGCIKVFDEEGVFLEDWPTPGQNPTNCTFSPDGHELIVTEAEKGQLICMER